MTTTDNAAKADKAENTDKEMTHKQKALELAMSHIDRQFGKGSIMKLGEKAASMEREAIRPVPFPLTWRWASEAFLVAESSRCSVQKRAVRQP